MRSRILPAIGVGAVAIALGVTFASGASAHHAVPTKSVVSHTVGHNSTHPAACPTQRDNDNGVGIVSQDFESAFDAYDSQGADDFGKCKKIKKVTADGAFFNGSGPAASYNVFIYKKGSTPGALVKQCNSSADTSASPSIPCTQRAKKGGWLSVQVVMNFSTGGEWGWNTNNTVRGNAAQWQNPGNGFSTGCTTYTTLTTCIAAGEGGDYSFGIN
jgi:hypothetical protein